MGQRISKADMKPKDPIAWQEGATTARATRRNVAEQVSELILDADLTGSRDFVARRVSGYAAAVASGDPAAERAALMELSTAAACTAAAIDLAHPKPRKRRAKTAALV